jgi:hypothetical protein
LPKNLNKNTDKIYQKLAETLFSFNEQGNNGYVLDKDLPLLKVRYMIDDYEELFDKKLVSSGHR